MSRDEEFQAIEAIYDALSEERPDKALVLARKTLADEKPHEDPVLRFLAGRALMELDRLEEAVAELSRAVELDGEDAEFRTDLAESLYRCCRFDEAYEHARRAGELDDSFADAHYLLALLLERRDATSEADFHFARAAALDGDRFPRPIRLESDEFDRQVEQARGQLPEAFRKHLDDVSVIVEELPPEALLCEETPPLDPEQLLGLFVGIMLGESRQSIGNELPPRIYLFKRNLERMVAGPDELAEQIRVTLFHELGHYLGMDEEELDAAGYA